MLYADAPALRRTRQRDDAIAELVLDWCVNLSPERTAKLLALEYEGDLVAEAVEHAAQFSEHYFGAQNDEWTAAVLAALREEEG